MNLQIGRCLIPQLLRERNWTQQYLADRTGIDKRDISDICLNKRRGITLLTAVAIADVLRVSPRELFEFSQVTPD